MPQRSPRSDLFLNSHKASDLTTYLQSDIISPRNMNNLHLPGARSGVSTPGTPQLLVENETYKEEDQPLYNALLRSLQSAMTAATAIDTGMMSSSVTSDYV